MSVVVTGAAGFVGGALLPELAAAGHAVVAVDRRPTPPAAGSPVPARTPGAVRRVVADLLDPRRRAELAGLLGQADAVVHLAGCPGVRDDAPDVALRRDRDNVRTARLVCALTPPDTPVVVLSSSSVYGGACGRACRETDPLAPRGGYAASKVAVEGVCAARAEHGRVLVVRPFTLLGAGQRPDMAVSLWADAVRRGTPVTVYGSLDRTRDLTCVRAAARGIQDLLAAGATGTVNLGSGRPRSLAELLGCVEDAVGRAADVRVLPAPEREVRDTWADTARLRTLVGWAPRTDLAAAVRDAVGAPAGVGAR